MATNADYYGPYDAGAGADATEDDWRKFMGLSHTNGVIKGYLNELAVTGDSSGMQVKLATGGAWINGAYGENTSGVKTLSIDASHATLNRYDLIVARNDYTNNRVEFDVVKGTPGASPTVPSATVDTTKYELPLAYVYIAATVSTITAANVTDQRPYATANSSFYRKTTLASAGDLITVDKLPARKYLRILISLDNSGNIAPGLRFNNDSGANYAYQSSYSGAAWSSTGVATNLGIQPTSASEAYGCFVVVDVMNLSTDYKVAHINSTDAFGTDATTSVNFAEYRGKWVSTSQVTRVDVFNGGGGDFTSGSEVVVIGHD